MKENIMQWVSDYQIVTHSWFTAQIDLSELYVKFLTAGDMNNTENLSKILNWNEQQSEISSNKFHAICLYRKDNDENSIKEYFTQIGNK